MKKTFVTIRCNTGKVSRQRRNGRDVMIVPSYTLPSGVVMNRIRYPEEEIDKAFKSFERTPAPLGHPNIEGTFVSASDPEGLARGWVGAWNENVRREGNRIAIDKVIDVDQANQLSGGKAILAAIEEGKPIHSSTGLYCMLEATTDDEEADFIARDIVGDHDCFLLGEEGAATPAQGVGVLVNAGKDADGTEIDVINSYIDDGIERDQMWALESLLRAGERKEQIPLMRRIISFIDAIRRGDPEPETVANQEVAVMDQAQFDALSAKVDALANAKPLSAEDVAAIVANAMKPMTDALEAQTKAATDKAEADRLELVNKVVEAKLLDEAIAKDAAAPVLNALLKKAGEPKRAYNLNRAFGGATDGKVDRASLAPKGE